MKWKIMTYNNLLNIDICLAEGETLEEAIKKFEPIKKNYNFYFIRKS